MRLRRRRRDLPMMRRDRVHCAWAAHVAAVVVATLVVVAGCGSNPVAPPPPASNPPSATAPPSVEPPPASGSPPAATVTSVAVSGEAFLGAIGDTTQFVATARFADGAQQVVTEGATWESSKPTVATVSPAGVVTAIAGGLTTIKATYGGRSGSVNLSVPVVGGSSHLVRVMYLVPQDREFNLLYRAAIRNAMVDLQGWYGRELGGPSFRWYSLAADECRLPQPAEYYAVDSWTKVYNDVQRCAPVSYASSTAWVIYADVVHACNAPGRLGAGALGLTMMGRQDLQGLAGESVIIGDCGENIWRPVGRWIGGLGHELGHAFGLPHPAGCDAGLSTCDGGALMWAGYALYPNTYLRADEKATLRASPFFTSTILSLGRRFP